jgi:hypothetical protein
LTTSQIWQHGLFGAVRVVRVAADVHCRFLRHRLLVQRDILGMHETGAKEVMAEAEAEYGPVEDAELPLACAQAELS